jgi:hypothetical protein
MVRPLKDLARGGLVALAAVACSTNSAEYVDCYPAIEEPVPLDAVSSLGFTGQQVADLVAGRWPVDVQSRYEAPQQRSFDFTFVPEGTAAVVQLLDHPWCGGAPGPFLAVPGTATGGFDGWVEGEGEAVIRASGPTPEDLTVAASLRDAEVSPALLEVLAPEFDGWCTYPDDLSVTVVQSGDLNAWSTGPSGWINADCGGKGVLFTHQWGAQLPAPTLATPPEG